MKMPRNSLTHENAMKSQCWDAIKIHENPMKNPCKANEILQIFIIQKLINRNETHLIKHTCVCVCVTTLLCTGIS